MAPPLRGRYGSRHPSTPTPKRFFPSTSMSRQDDAQNTCWIDGIGRKEDLPRPHAMFSAEAVYGDFVRCPMSPTLSPKSPAADVVDDLTSERSANQIFVWNTLQAIPLRPAHAAKDFPIPLASIISPFADGADSEMLPIADNGAEDALRCPRCRSYANPFWQWSKTTPKSLRCNMCEFSSEVPETFMKDMDNAGYSADEEHHPELAFGSVDILAPSSLDLDRPAKPEEPVALFVLEASATSVACGFFSAALDAIELMLDESELFFRRRLGIMLFDSELHFFVPMTSGRFRRTVVEGEEEPFLPVAPATLFMDIGDVEGRATFRDLLEDLRNSEKEEGRTLARCSVAGSALRIAIEVLTSAGGGDIVLMQSTAPSRGLGSPLLTPLQFVDFQNETLELCTKGSVAVNVVTAPPEGLRLDMETMDWLVWRTGGDALHMPAFNPSSTKILTQHLRHWAGKAQGSAYGCVVKLRCSKGLNCVGLQAAWPAAPSAKDKSAFELARISPDTCFAYMLQADCEEEDDLNYLRRTREKQYRYIQVAVLYTNARGRRLLRVHTSAIAIASSVRSAFQAASVEPLITFAMKQAIFAQLQGIVPEQQRGAKVAKVDPKDVLLDFLFKILAGYRRNCFSGRVNNGTLVIGKPLILLPLYVLCARKLISATGREELHKMMRMPIHSLLAALYPRIYPVHMVGTEDDENSANEGDFTGCSTTASTALPQVSLPTPLAPMHDSILRGKSPAYLMTNGLGAWLYLSPSEATPRPFGCGDFRLNEAGALWTRAMALTKDLREALQPSPVAMSLRELTNLSTSAEQTKDQKMFMSTLFVEDQGFTDMSYSEWIIFLVDELRLRGVTT